MTLFIDWMVLSVCNLDAAGFPPYMMVCTRVLREALLLKESNHSFILEDAVSMCSIHPFVSAENILGSHWRLIYHLFTWQQAMIQ